MDSFIGMNSSGEFVVVWSDAAQDGSGTGVFGQRYSAAGTALGSEFQINTYTDQDQAYPSVAVDSNGNFMVAWESQGQDGSGLGVYGQRYGTNGNTIGSEFQINTYTTNNQFLPFVAMFPTGDFVVTWVSFGQDGSAEGVFGRRYVN